MDDACLYISRLYLLCLIISVGNNDDDTFNFNQIAKDLAVLESFDKTAQKFVGDAANKAKVQFIKEKHNIDLGKEGNGQLQLEDKEAQKKNEDAIWGM